MLNKRTYLPLRLKTETKIKPAIAVGCNLDAISLFSRENVECQINFIERIDRSILRRISVGGGGEYCIYFVALFSSFSSISICFTNKVLYEFTESFIALALHRFILTNSKRIFCVHFFFLSLIYIS